MTIFPGKPGDRIAFALILSLLFLFPIACTPQPYRVTREPTALRIVATSCCEPLAQKAVSEYQAAHPWVTTTIEVLNNALAADALAQAKADIGLLSWPPALGVEREAFWTQPFARDAVAVIVHPASSFSDVDVTLLRDIFLGRVQETGGVILTVVSREEGSATRAAFEAVVLGGGETSLNAVVMPSAESMIEYVASNPAAIGYVSTGCVDGRVRTLAVEGALPTEEAIANGLYPISRDIYLASAGEPTGEARQFAQWILRSGFVRDSEVRGIVAR